MRREKWCPQYRVFTGALAFWHFSLRTSQQMRPQAAPHLPGTHHNALHSTMDHVATIPGPHRGTIVSGTGLKPGTSGYRDLTHFTLLTLCPCTQFSYASLSWHTLLPCSHWLLAAFPERCHCTHSKNAKISWTLTLQHTFKNPRPWLYSIGSMYYINGGSASGAP